MPRFPWGVPGGLAFYNGCGTPAREAHHLFGVTTVPSHSTYSPHRSTHSQRHACLSTFASRPILVFTSASRSHHIFITFLSRTHHVLITFPSRSHHVVITSSLGNAATPDVAAMLSMNLRGDREALRFCVFQCVKLFPRPHHVRPWAHRMEATPDLAAMLSIHLQGDREALRFLTF